ncbi:signal peptidase I [bacterium]|nr:signal peptidase I [bacterium]
MMKALNYIFYGIFVTMMLAIAGLLVASMLPIPGNIELKIVKSGSMEPTIPTGSLVIVKPMQSYGIDDVITFGADTKTEIPTTHRIIGYESDAEGRSVFRTKGDANEDQDANPVPRGEVIGKVVFHLPYVGFVLDFARQPLGFALLIGVPAALVIVEEVLTITKEVKAALVRRRKKEEGDEDTDDEPSHGSGGTRLREVAAERTVYLRKRAMDEIFVPMVSETRTWVREKLPLPKDAYASGTIAVGVLVGISVLTTGGMQGTLAYFTDIETSIGNVFRAGEWGEEEEEQPIEVARMLAPEGEVAGAATESETPTEIPAEEPAPEEEEAAQTAPIEPVEPAAEPETPAESTGGQTAPIEPPAAETPAPEPAVEEAIL